MSLAANAIEIVAVPIAARATLTPIANQHQPELDLQFLLSSGVSAVPLPKLRLVRPQCSDPAGPTPSYATADESDLEDFTGRHPTPTSQLPDPAAWAARLAQAIIEVRAGLRPHHQLSRWTSHSVLTELRLSPLANARQPARMHVTSVHIGQPLDGVIEACAVVAGTARSLAVAIRLEGWDGRWICTSAAVI